MYAPASKVQAPKIYLSQRLIQINHQLSSQAPFLYFASVRRAKESVSQTIPVFRGLDSLPRRTKWTGLWITSFFFVTLYARPSGNPLRPLKTLNEAGGSKPGR